MSLESTTIEFQIGKTKYVFTVEHNLGDLDKLVQSWLARTHSYNPQCFCNYVTGKDPVNNICKVVKTVYT